MTLACMYYDDIGQENHLELHLFDGTIRNVIFLDGMSKAAALVAGRAAIDCTAIEHGLLPRGATLVSQASASNAAALIEDLRDREDKTPMDPLAATRLAFSLKLLVARSESIDGERDAEARRANPLAAGRYDAIVQTLIDCNQQDGKDSD